MKLIITLIAVILFSSVNVYADSIGDADTDINLTNGSSMYKYPNEPPVTININNGTPIKTEHDIMQKDPVPHSEVNSNGSTP